MRREAIWRSVDNRRVGLYSVPRQHNFLPQPHLGTSIGLTTLDSCLQLSLFADLCMRACRLLSLIAYAARGWCCKGGRY